MKRMKQFLALALAGIMSLSCVTLAGATDASDYAGGTQTGKGEFEAVLPDGHVKIVLPTTVSGAFDMILDPHSLIKQTGAARYTTSGSAAPTFEGEESEEEADQVYLFFHNVDADKEYDYSSKSDAYTILNKSSFDVDVKVSVELEKGLAGDSFSMVEKNALANADGAAMYLGLNVQDITAEEGTTAGEYTFDDSASQAQEIAVVLADDAGEVDAAPSAGVTGTKLGTTTSGDDLLKAKAIISDVNVVFVAGATAADKAEVIAALTKSRAETTSGAGDGVTAASIAFKYTKSTGEIEFTGTLPTKTTAPDTLIPETYTASPSASKVTASVAGTSFNAAKDETFKDAYFSIPVQKSVTVGGSSVDVTVAKIRGKISGAKAFAAGDNAEGTITFTSNNTKVAPLSSATYSETLGAFDSAYANVFKANSVGSSEGEYVLAYYADTDNYNNTQATEKLAELAASLEPIKGLKFNLVGAINPSDDWDNLNDAAKKIDIAVIWDVSEASARAKLPTLAIDSDNGSAIVFKWTAGTGKYASYAPKIGSNAAGGVKYTQSGTAKYVTTTAGTTADTFKATLSSTVRAATNTNFVIIFTCDGQDDIEIPFPDGWR